MTKKLQVFVSSTYTDLIEERQVAVQAILDAGHIPAGMELFKAGKSQMQTIRKWIDDSDVYMLILGGRYGSIEPVSDKSYTQLEYEYALSKNMPVFAIVLDDNFLYTKASFCGKDTIFEKGNTYKYNSFKDKVESNIVKYVKNIDQISSVVHAQLNNIINDPDYNLIGWIRNTSENDIYQLSKDIANLLKENNSLNKQIQKLQEQINTKSKEPLGNYTFDNLLDILEDKNFTIPGKFFGESENVTYNALDTFVIYYKYFCTGIPSSFLDQEECEWVFLNICPYFLGLKLIKKGTFDNKQNYEIDTFGISFYTELEINGLIEE